MQRCVGALAEYVAVRRLLFTFYGASAQLAMHIRVLATVKYSLCSSVRQFFWLILCQKDASSDHKIFTFGQPEESTLGV